MRSNYSKDESERGLNYRGDEKPFHHPERMERDAEQCLGDVDMWLSIGFTCGMHLKHILDVLRERGLIHILEDDTSIKKLYAEELLNKSMGTGKSRFNAESVAKEKREENRAKQQEDSELARLLGL